MVVYDPELNRAWSIKLSLSEAVGQFRDKPYPVRDAQVRFRASEAILRSEAGLIEWLARKPGAAAALIYEKMGLLQNSNRSQNTVLLIGEGGKPERILLREPDYELDKIHPEADQTYTQIPSGIFSRPAFLDCSMLNGMKEKFPDTNFSRFLKFVFSYFYSFFETSTQIRHEPFHQEAVEAIASGTATGTLDEITTVNNASPTTSRCKHPINATLVIKHKKFRKSLLKQREQTLMPSSERICSSRLRVRC